MKKYRNSTRKEANCIVCNKEFSFWPKQSRGLFCSNKCCGTHKVQKVFCEDSFLSACAKKYLKEEYFTYECSICGISDWLGMPLTLQIDHINGNNRDNRFDNLRLLCANCHTQTDTWGNPNRKK